MKVIILSAIIISLLIGAPAFASAKDNCPPEGCDLPHAKDPQAAYKSGYEHGLADSKAGCADRCHWYILEPKHSFAFHTRCIMTYEFSRILAGITGSPATLSVYHPLVMHT